MNFQPSTAFLTKIKNTKVIDRFLKEFEIFSYFNERVPIYLNDNHWENLIQLNTIKERVLFWDFVGLNQHREQMDNTKKLKQKDFNEKNTSENEALFKNGGMAYGNRFYRLLLNPFRQSKTTDDCVLYKNALNYLLNDSPKILLDVQYTSAVESRIANLLGDQTEKIIAANFYNSKRSLPLEFINSTREVHFKDDFYGRIGFCNRDEKRKNSLLPEIHTNNPYHDYMRNDSNVKEEDQIIYISRYASKQLDGPLIHQGYVIPITLDKDRESFAMCKKNRYRSMSLPIDKYIKWQSGTKAMPFVNILKIIMELNCNGCNWEKALYKNIAKRHLKTHEELINSLSTHQHKRREHRENINKIINMIEQANLS